MSTPVLYSGNRSPVLACLFTSSSRYHPYCDQNQILVHAEARRWAFSFLMRITVYSLTKQCCVSQARANIHLNQLRHIFLSVCIGPTYQEGWARTRTGMTHQSTRIAFSFSLPSLLINCMHTTSPIYFSIGNRFSSASSPPLRLHLHPNPTAFTLF